jgi:putative transposase
MVRRHHSKLSLVRQCVLLGLSHASLYHQPAPASEEDLELMALMDRQYLKTPFYGSRRMTAWLRQQGHRVNRKRVRRLMGLMGPEPSICVPIPASLRQSTRSIPTCYGAWRSIE